MADVEPEDAAEAARALVRSTGKAALGTVGADGAPLVTLVALATDTVGAPVLLLSRIAAHTGNIARDPRVSLMVTGAPTDDDPMTAPRLSINGSLRVLSGDEAARAKRQFLARHPGSAPYDTELDFTYYRLEIAGARFNQGFGAFRKLGPGALLDDEPGGDHR